MTKYQTSDNGKKFPLNYYSLFLLAGLILTVTTLFPLRAEAQSDGNDKWLGSYTFDDTAQAPKRRTSLDVVPLTNYDINIEETDGKLTAAFSENGVQVFQAYECSVKTTGDTIEFYFEKFAAPGVKDLRRFKKGDLLFTLVETRVGKTTKYLFQPAAYKITRHNKSERNERIYFVKQ